jgi:two-component system, NtrC family, sensor kinase
LEKGIGKDHDIPSFCDENEAFITLVNESYFDFDEERTLLERSIDISSIEYYEKLDENKSLHDSLVSSEKMAGIGQLSAGIAHEINNPLGYIQSNIDVLAKYIRKLYDFHSDVVAVLKTAQSADPTDGHILASALLERSDDKQLEAIYQDLPAIVSETQEGVQRISRIVRSLLNFSHRELETMVEGFDLNKGLKDTLIIAHNEIKYFAEVEENYGKIPLITCNPDEVNQVLLNIIMNAVSAIRSRGIPGLIRLRTHLDGNYVCCDIEDNGGGIADEYLPHIFEPFFTTKPVGSGTGLGLSISYDIIVNKHSGKIDVRTTAGEGTTFTICFPLNKDEENEYNELLGGSA